MLEEIENLRAKSFEELVVLENLAHFQFAHFFAEAFARLCHDVRLHASVHVVLDVDAVLLGDLHEHTDVVLIVRIFLLIWVQQVLVLFEILDHFAVDSLVLERSVQNDKDLSCDGPVVQVRDMSFKDELEGTDWADLILVFTIQALEHVYL